MTWLRFDDDMLDHEKWRSALREGGDAVLLVWFRLTSWCSRRLTDGRIPAKMVAEIACLERSKSRARALEALVESGLCARHIDGAIVISGYLERNPSKADVLAERDRRAKAQRDYADRKKLTGQRPIRLPGPDPVGLPEPDDVPSQSHPNPVPIPEEGERAPTLLPPSKRERRLDAQALSLNRLIHKYPPDFEPTKANQTRGHELGLSDEEIWQRWFESKEKPYPHGFEDPEAQFNRELAWAKSDREKRVFKTQSERDAFENPGRERRPA